MAAFGCMELTELQGITWKDAILSSSMVVKFFPRCRLLFVAGVEEAMLVFDIQGGWFVVSKDRCVKGGTLFTLFKFLFLFCNVFGGHA